MTHICVSKLTIIGSDNGLSPGRRQAIICTNAGILIIWTLGTYFSEILSETHTFSLKKRHLKMSSGRRRPFCLGLNVLNLCNSFEDQATLDFIVGRPIFKWIAETWLHDRISVIDIKAKYRNRYTFCISFSANKRTRHSLTLTRMKTRASSCNTADHYMGSFRQSWEVEENMAWDV